MNRIATRLPVLFLFLFVAAPFSAKAADIQLRLIKTVNSSAGAGLFKNLKGFWFDKSEGSFFVLDENPLTVYKFDRSGNSLKYYRIDEMNLPDAIIAGTAGTEGIYVHSSRGLFLLSPDFTTVSEMNFFFTPPPSGEEDKPQKVPLNFVRVFLSSKGVLYGFDPEKKILYECDENFSCRVFIRTVMKYGASVLTGRMKSVYQDPWSRFYFVDEQAQRVWKFAAAGEFIGPAAEPLNPAQERLFSPEFVVVDRMKRCYIYDSGNRSIRVYNDLGLPAGEIDAHPPQGPLFVFPAAFEIDDYNRLYVLDRGDMTVKIFEVNDTGF